MRHRKALLIGLLTAIMIIPASGEEIILCGGEEVFSLTLPSPINGPPLKTWSWRARDCAELPTELKDAFRTTDDCKPIDEGRMILITSSGGGVALVERKTGKALFYAAATNAHSADVLPAGRVAVASSVGQTGNRLILFDLKWPDKPLYSDVLHSAHGVVWDEDLGLLWALGGDELRSYRLVNWDTDRPSLARVAIFPLPSRGGHDLIHIPGTSKLLITASRRVYEFDRESHRFGVYTVLDGRGAIKSISIHPVTGQAAYTMAGNEGWWTDRVLFLDPESEIILPGERLYKVRWNVAPRLPLPGKGLSAVEYSGRPWRIPSIALR